MTSRPLQIRTNGPGDSTSAATTPPPKKAVPGSSLSKGMTALAADDAHLDAAFAALAEPDGAADPSRDRLELSAKEQTVLDLYDELEDLVLQRAILTAQANVEGNPLPSDAEATPDLVEAAKRSAMEAKAQLALRDSIARGVLQADPILKAVHAGANAMPTERKLHPHLTTRDTLSLAHANLSQPHLAALRALTAAQARSAAALEENRALAARLFRLADELGGDEAKDLLAPLDADGSGGRGAGGIGREAKKSGGGRALRDEELREELETALAEERDARKRYRILKFFTAGIVAGSGVDWAGREEWRDMVLDPED